MAMTKQIWTRSAAVESGPKGRLIRVCKARVYQSTETTRRSHPGNWLNSHRSPLVHSTLSFSLPLCQPAPSSQPSSRLLISSIVWPYPLLPFPIILRQYMYKCMKLFVPPPVWRGGRGPLHLFSLTHSIHPPLIDSGFVDLLLQGCWCWFNWLLYRGISHIAYRHMEREQMPNEKFILIFVAWFQPKRLHYSFLAQSSKFR